MVSVPLAVVRVIGVVPLAANCANVIGAPPLMVSEVSEAAGPKLNVPDVFSPVPAGLLPLAKSLSFTCASVPPTTPSVKPLKVTTSLTGIILKFNMLAVGSVSTPPLAMPPLS